MDPWDKLADGRKKTFDLPPTAIHGEQVPYVGLRNGAGVFGNPVHHHVGEGSAEYSQLGQLLDKMSISDNTCLGAGGFSTKPATSVHVLPKENMTVAQTGFYEQNDTVLTSGYCGNKRYDHNNRGSTQFFQIPPRMIFFGALKSVGIDEADIIDVGFRGAHKVRLQFVCKLPLCLQQGSQIADITGEVCVSYELAEASAIKKSFDHLYNMHNVVLLDISYHKKQDHTHNCRNMYCNVVERIKVVGDMIQHWLECLDNLYQVEKITMFPMQFGGLADSNIASGVLAFLVSVKDNTMDKIRSCDRSLKRLAARKDDFAKHSKSLTCYYRKASMVKAHHYEKDVLSLLLRWLRLEECQFWAEPVDGGRYLGAVMLSYPETQNVIPPGDVCVEADREESTVEEAMNRAATMAIYRLEQEFNVEMVGLNHSEAVLAGRESSIISGLNIELMLLGTSVSNYWEEMLKKINESVCTTKNALALLQKGTSFHGESDFDTNFSYQYELAAAKCYELFKLDAAKFRSLN